MKTVGFDNEKYLKMQSAHIKERFDGFDGKLYLEFGGKLFDDFHASRVLPGFAPDSKLKMLMELSSEAEIIITINASDIEKNKLRGDLGITYDAEVIRLIGIFQDFGLFVSGVVITQYSSQPAADAFIKRLENLKIKVYLHYSIEGYPTNVSHIVSEEGYGKNDYLETSRPLVIITAPGPGSGKMAVCLSQLYHDHKRGLHAGYAKFETFPVWNLPLRHPVNIAYEAATADLNDVNIIDPFHLEAYGEQTVNYNRDVEIFPVLNAIFEKILGESPYKSPTDMGVNMAARCIIDDEVVCEASKQEILRRYYAALCDAKIGIGEDSTIYKLEILMKQAGVTKEDRKVIHAALEKAKLTSQEDELFPAAAIELPDGQIVTGKTSDLLGAASAALLNALKKLAGLDDEAHIIAPSVIEPISKLKTMHFGNKNPRLHTDEILIALAISATTNPMAEDAYKQIPHLAGCEAHSTVILSSVDQNTFRKLKVNLTCEPLYQKKKRPD